MCVLNDRPLALFLDLCRAHGQEAHGTRFHLALCPDDDGLASIELSPAEISFAGGSARSVVVNTVARMFGRRGIARGESSSGRREAGSHEGGAREDEANGAAIDAHGGKCVGEAVDEAEMWEQRIGHVLIEERSGGEEIERRALRTSQW